MIFPRPAFNEEEAEPTVMSPVSRRNFFGSGSEADDEKTPAMCGTQMLSRLMRKKSSKMQIGPLDETQEHHSHGTSGSGRRMFMNPAVLKRNNSNRKYAEVPTLQDTESSSSVASEKSTGWQNLEEPLQADLVPQFDPTELQVTAETDGEVEVHANIVDPDDGASPEMLNRSTGSWSARLPSVAEEEVEDDYMFSRELEASPSDEETAESHDSQSGDSSQTRGKQDILEAMRELVLKQQDALKELSDQNYECRQEMENQQLAMLRLRKESEQRQARVYELKEERDNLKSRVEELKVKLKRAMGKSTSNSGRQFRWDDESSACGDSLDTPRNNQSEVVAFQPFTKPSSPNSHEEWEQITGMLSDLSSSRASASRRESQRCHDTEENRQDIHVGPSRRSDEGDEGRDKSLISHSTMQVTLPRPDVGSQLSKEELELYRNRLEKIQKRRSLRKKETRSTVRFADT